MKRNAKVAAAIAIVSALIIFAILAVGISYASSEEASETSFSVTISSAAEGYDSETSTPAVAAVTDGDGTQAAYVYDASGTLDLELEGGAYEISYISPVNADGSVYLVPDPSTISVEVDEDGAVTAATLTTDGTTVVCDVASVCVIEADYTLVDGDDTDEEYVAEVLAALEEAAALDDTEVTDEVLALATSNAAVATDKTDDEGASADEEADEETSDGDEEASTEGDASADASAATTTSSDESTASTTSGSSDSTTTSSSGSTDSTTSNSTSTGSSTSSGSSTSGSSSSTGSTSTGSTSSSGSTGSSSSGSTSSSSSTSGSASSSSSSSSTSTHTHSYTSTVTTEATCVTAGVRTYTCSCGDTYTEAIAATGKHTWVTVKTVDVYICYCGEVFYSSDDLDAHNMYYYKQGITSGHFTYRKGYGYYEECAVCGKTIWEGAGSGPY